MLKNIYKDKTYAVYEQPPTKRSVIINSKIYFIEFPRIVFIINESDNNLYVAFLDKPFNIENNIFIIPFVGTFSVCLSNLQNKENKSPTELIDYFWSSSWESHVSINCLCEKCRYFITLLKGNFPYYCKQPFEVIFTTLYHRIKNAPNHEEHF